MKNKVLVIQHMTRERPGFILDILEEEGIHYDRVDLAKGDVAPGLESYDALVMLGSTESVNENTPRIQTGLEILKDWIRSDKAYLGICLGMQLLIKAAGGNVVKNSVKEVGFRDEAGHFYTVKLTDEGRHDPLFAGLGDTLNVFQCHEDTVEIVSGVVVLATGAHCTHQAVRVGSAAYGVQGHFELTREMLDIWKRENSDVRALDQNKLERDFIELEGDHIMSGSRIFKNFLY